MLTRSFDDKIVGGVCGGIAKKLNMSSKTVRWIFVILVLLGGISLWLYLLAWIVLPQD
jgi:phage shock protein C